jgi:selenocysteine-specific elongation factor
VKRLVIGTAGHIDHGKTTLVKALTGIETDRLKEEKQRGISIELGFAPFTLPSGQKAAIVDVPGHERFIRHMLAGAFGIDMVIFTIAADEGVMPQTREHMDIIELLGVNQGVIVLTKKDMVDEEWLLMVEEEIKEYTDKTILKGTPIIAVSALTKEGIPDLLAALEELANRIKEKPKGGQVRLPIDRVFTISGFGTVVTGTLWSGSINVGDTLELMPVGRPVKVRTLQVHGEKVPVAYAGQRVAVNLQGIEVNDIKRGYLLATPGFLQPGYRVDAKLRLLPSSPRTLKNWNRIRFHIGTDETMGRVILLDRDELLPGEETFVQIVMEKPVVCYKGDSYVIRYYSPVTTIGGGVIINANSPKQKRFNEDVLNELVMKEEGTLYDILLHEMESHPEELFNLDSFIKKTGSSADKVKDEIAQLLEDEKIIDLTGKGEYLSNYGISVMADKITSVLAEFHKQYPLRQGYPREDMRSRFFTSLNAKMFNMLLKHLEAKRGIIKSKNNLIMLAPHEPLPGEREEKYIREILTLMTGQLFSPPSPQEMKETLGISDTEFSEIFSYLVEQQLVIKLNETMFFSTQAIEEGKKILNQYFDREKELNLATMRDLLNTSRKYVLPLIEYYDRIRFTRRVGDMRVRIG